MDHKAYAFDWNAFARGLRPILVGALADDDPAPLARFIDRNRDRLTDPYAGEPLPEDWRSLLEAGDVQELGDFALTRYYQPADDHGVTEEWLELHEQLQPAVQAALLGKPIGPEGNLFDPGRQGAYFQTPARVRRSLVGVWVSELAPYRSLLRRCAGRGLGVYVTF